MGQVLSCETVYSEVPIAFRCREGNISHSVLACMGEPRAVLDLVHVEKFFARYLGGLIRDRHGTPARLMKAKAER
jgi:hypothetical protein